MNSIDTRDTKKTAFGNLKILVNTENGDITPEERLVF